MSSSSAAAPAASNRSIPTSKPKKKPVVTPAAAALQEASLRERMSVDKNIVDELLLVCGVIGTTLDEKDELVPVTDCLNWLQDLQRALRRDDDLYRPVSLLLGQWKVVEQKLLPLILHARYDSTLVLTVCKILVILTKPLAENTVRAGKMVIDTKSRKTPERYVDGHDEPLQYAHKFYSVYSSSPSPLNFFRQCDQGTNKAARKRSAASRDIAGIQTRVLPPSLPSRSQKRRRRWTALDLCLAARGTPQSHWQRSNGYRPLDH